MEPQTQGGGRPGTAWTDRPATYTWRRRPQVASILRRLACVPMMQASDHGYLDDSALVGVLHRSGLRGVLLQREVRSTTVVVGEVVSQQATQLRVVQHHDVVEALAAQGADEPFHVRILPGDRGAVLTSWIPWPGLDSRTRPVDCIAVAQQVSRGGVPGERLHELLGRPLGRGASVTLMWRTRRRSCARTTKTNKTLNITVGTVKKSTETRLPTWWSRKVRQVCDGGVRWRTIYLETVAWEISRPSFWSSP